MAVRSSHGARAKWALAAVCLLGAAVGATVEAAAAAADSAAQLAAARQAMLDRAVLGPMRVQSLAWLDAQGRLEEMSVFQQAGHVPRAIGVPSAEPSRGFTDSVASAAEDVPPAWRHALQWHLAWQQPAAPLPADLRERAERVVLWRGVQAVCAELLATPAAGRPAEPARTEPTARWSAEWTVPAPLAGSVDPGGAAGTSYWQAVSARGTPPPSAQLSFQLALESSSEGQPEAYLAWTLRASDGALLDTGSVRWPLAWETERSMVPVLHPGAMTRLRAALGPVRTQWSQRLSDLPLQVPVRSADGRQFELPLGHQHGLRLGQHLLLADRREGAGDPLSERGLPQALLEVSEVGPQSARARLQAGRAPAVPKAGDWVAFPLDAVVRPARAPLPSLPSPPLHSPHSTAQSPS